MEMTLENKEKFFVQYWGQKIYNEEGHWNGEPVNANSMAILNGIYTEIQQPYILLKSLSLITDEDAIEIAMLGYGKEVPYYTLAGHAEQGKEILNIYSNKSTKKRYSHWSNLYMALPEITDYLRSKGYALPYMGLSVENQIEYGWVKLIE